MYVMALSDGMREFADGVSFTRGLPAGPIPANPPPTVAAVLAAFRAAGCHGTAWFRLSDADPAAHLPECPNPSACDGLDLGEINIHAGQVIDLGTPVDHLAFRKPHPAAVLAAACALAGTCGPRLVFDDSCEDFFAVHPGETAAALRADWPW
ncbi:hypothetical protein GCM10025331_57450 [Actinoplanes utahensis]|uniref:Uncharacterized protein n=2 Tax=Actinoplanes utahensis TaxID=1869 RepID=A0A0A6UQP7_ACTUT|nr:hypothetical protein MB27_11295 [Actinoplanes utahensis]GIF32916.1 hypothetical protein Aut01nite_59020 [Actinoplanes utahensis]